MIIKERNNAILRTLEASDLERIFSWRNSYRIRSASIQQSVISWHDHRAWFERTSKDRQARLLIFEMRRIPRGFVHFFDMDEERSESHWGFYIGDESAPKGAGTLMCDLALEYMFLDEGFEQVIGEVLYSNVRSQSFHKKLGFRFSEEYLHPSKREKIFVYRCEKKMWKERAA